MESLPLLSPSRRPTPLVRQDKERAVAHIEEHVKDEVRWQTEPSEDGLHLRKHAQSIFKPAEGDAKGTVLLFHGFTAGPWQYKQMASKLQEAGYNVYAPRMPGHGLAEADGKPSVKEMPKTTELQVWDEFVDETYQDAAALGAPVYAVGLSGGANVAVRMADRHEEVAGVVAMAPFLGSDGLKGALFPVINMIDVITFGLCGKLLDAIPRKEKGPIEDDPTPRTQGTWGQALSMYRVGAEVDGIEPSLQLITTDNDILSGKRAHKKLLKGSEGGGDDGWFHFPAKDGVKHAMLSRDENPNTQSVETIEAIIANFVAKGQLTQQPPA